MTSAFWDNVYNRLGKTEKSQKWLADKSGVGKTVINSGISRKSSPNVDNAFAIAQVFGLSIEELLAGESGAEYVRKVVGNDPIAIQVPERIYSLVESLLLLDEYELEGMKANAEILAKHKKGNQSRAVGTDDQKKVVG